jgi:hypothetical protein
MSYVSGLALPTYHLANLTVCIYACVFVCVYVYVCVHVSM